MFTAPFSGNQRCNSAINIEGPMLLKHVFSMTRKYLVSPTTKTARLSGGGHVMAAWEATMSTYPTSPFGRWRRSRAFSSTPEKPPHGVGVWSLGKKRDRALTLSACVFVSPKMCLCFRPAMAQAHKPPTQCGYAGEYTRSSVRFMLAENSLRRRNTRMYRAASNSREHVVVDYVSNIYFARKAYISSGGDASTTTIIHQHNTPLQHTRTTATSPASFIATHSPQR